MMSDTEAFHQSVENSPAGSGPRRFNFSRDRFAFANELNWAYHHDAVSGRTTFAPRNPKPNYTLRCFVLARAARQFLYHAQFNPAASTTDERTYRRQIREIISRNPRIACPAGRRVVIAGYEGLHEFSTAWESLLKAECGGAWRSYVLRSHWRMVFPISRQHQCRTAETLAARLRNGGSPIIHLVRFPQLTINHGMVLFDVDETSGGLEFDAYDPNDPTQPTRISYDARRQFFSLPANAYWAGGRLDIIEIFRSWFL